MSYKVYKSQNYFVVHDTTTNEDVIRQVRNLVRWEKKGTLYSFYYNTPNLTTSGNAIVRLGSVYEFSDLVDSTGSAWVSQTVFDEYLEQWTGHICCPSTLESLSNVKGGATDGQYLKYVASSGLWEPTTLSTGLTIGTTPITSGTDNRVLFQSSGKVSQSSNFVFTPLNQLVIGGHSASAVLDVKSQGALSTDIAFRVRNSADTANIFTVNGDGTQNWFTPGMNVLNSIKSGTFNIIQYGNDAFGNIALGYNSSNMIVPTTTYNTVLGANASSGANSGFAIGIGWGSVVNGAGNICIGRTRTTGNYSIKLGYDGGPSSYGGTNSIHLGRTVSGNDVLADDVFMTYFNSQSSSTLTRSNGSFGLLGQQAYILGNGTGTYGTNTFMGNGGNTFVVRNHPSVPSTNIVDSFQQYSADIVAGNAAPHFRTEAGNIIKLFTGAALTTPDGTLSNAVARIAELEARLQANGLIL